MTKLSLIERKLLFEVSHFKGIHSGVLFFFFIHGYSEEVGINLLNGWGSGVDTGSTNVLLSYTAKQLFITQTK